MRQKAVKQRWWHRYEVQGKLVKQQLVYGWYGKRYFITDRRASKFQAQLYKDHGPGHIKVSKTKLRGRHYKTEMS